MKNSVDYAQKNFYTANQTIKKAVEMESTDVPKAIQLYQAAIQNYQHVKCQHTATVEQIDTSNKMIDKCTKRVNELLQFLSGNPNLQQPSTPSKMGKTVSSTTITTPSPTAHQQLNPNSKNKSSNQILKPGAPPQQNIYQTQFTTNPQQNNAYSPPPQIQQTINFQQPNIYQTQAQPQQSTNQQQPNIYQTQAQPQQTTNQQQPNIYQTQVQPQQTTSQQQSNIYQTQAQPQQTTNQQQSNIYQTQAQVQQPTNTQQSSITQTQTQVQQPTKSQQPAASPQPATTQQTTSSQSDMSSNTYEEAYTYLENGLMMDNDAFYDLAKYFYEKSITLFTTFITTATQINQNNVNFWMYQLRQRSTALDFFSTKSQDAPSYYFNTSFHMFDETKALQTSESENAEVIQRKVDKSISDCISLLKKCIISSKDPSLTKLAEDFLKNTMASNMKDTKDDGFHTNCIETIYPDPINSFASEKLKNQLSSISSDSSKKFILLFGPSGTKITNLIQYTASKSSVKMIFEVNFMKFIGINDNPVNILNTAIENAKQQSPSYLILSHIDACLKEDSANDNLSKMISDFLISHLSAGIEGVTIFCTTELPWVITPTSVFNKFDAKIYYPAPDESLIKEILKNNQITKRISDDKIAQMASELIGYTEFGIQRILIEAQISNAIRSSGGLRDNILYDISTGLILRNEITIQDIKQAKDFIPPIVTQSGLIFFDQILDTVK